MKLKSSSSSRSSFSGVLRIGIYIIILNVTYSNGLNPLIHLSSTATRVVINIEDFGAKGDGLSDDTHSLGDVWKLGCSSPSPATILIPARKSYLIRPIDFSGPCRSKLTLKVSGNIVAPYDLAAWDGLNVRKWLYFHGVNNLRVEGGGTIKGMGQEWWARSCNTNHSNPCTHAPTAVTFHKCKNLKLRNINLIYGQEMHVAFTQCTHVAASGITVVAPADSPNTEGIHISGSTRVELKNLIIATGDDCISIVGNSSKIRVKDIVCGPGHGISIGSLGKYNSSSSVEDVTVSGAVLFNTENGVRIKTWQGGGGFARKITFDNIWMQNVSNPIRIDQYYCNSPATCLNQTSAVSIDRVYFRNIKGTSATDEAIVLACSDSYPCKRLYLENIQLVGPTGNAKSFCWEAYGTSSGLVYPPSCLSSGDFVIRYQVRSNSTRWRDDDLFDLF